MLKLLRARRRSRQGEEGFTLIGLLATIVVVNVLPAQDTAMRRKAEADIALLEQAVEMYRLDMFAYPPVADGLQALVTVPAGLGNAARYRSGGYIKRLPDDPWGNGYQYAFPGRHGPFDIYSLGADGREGGEGENADIGNWK